jgi:UDP-N-acetylmuramoyl-L-alanyl-D-glutamate--2,6-diaminopimelate ligase
VLDRREAITTAIREAAPEDVIIVAGKGHETEQTVGTKVVHFSDVEVSKEALAERSVLRAR